MASSRERWLALEYDSMASSRLVAARLKVTGMYLPRARGGGGGVEGPQRPVGGGWVGGQGSRLASEAALATTKATARG